MAGFALSAPGSDFVPALSGDPQVTLSGVLVATFLIVVLVGFALRELLAAAASGRTSAATEGSQNRVLADYDDLSATAAGTTAALDEEHGESSRPDQRLRIDRGVGYRYPRRATRPRVPASLRSDRHAR